MQDNEERKLALRPGACAKADDTGTANFSVEQSLTYCAEMMGRVGLGTAAEEEGWGAGGTSLSV